MSKSTKKAGKPVKKVSTAAKRAAISPIRALLSPKERLYVTGEILAEMQQYKDELPKRHTGSSPIQFMLMDMTIDNCMRMVKRVLK